MWAERETETRWHAVSRRGPRRVNADATAVHRDPVTGRSVYVVADGVGDSGAARAAAQMAARTAACAAVHDGPEAAVLAAQAGLADAARNDLPDAARNVLADAAGDCVLVVVVPGEYSCDIAWVGDCRAYYSNGRVLEQITVDHTVAEYFRSRNREVTPRMEHLVTTSVRTVKPGRIGTSRTGLAAGRLLLCSDGVHRSLSAPDIRAVLDQPVDAATAARLLADRALDHGGRDNSTALVVDHVLPEPRAAAA